MFRADVRSKQGCTNERPGETAISKKKSTTVRGGFSVYGKVEADKEGCAQNERTDAPVNPTEREGHGSSQHQCGYSSTARTALATAY